jgi:ankyrin repeat protein
VGKYLLKKHEHFIDFLLEHNADIHATDDDGDTPLHKAASRNRLSGIEKLIKAGADVSARNNKGHTALAEAIQARAGNFLDINGLHHIVLLSSPLERTCTVQTMMD